MSAAGFCRRRRMCWSGVYNDMTQGRSTPRTSAPKRALTLTPSRPLEGDQREPATPVPFQIADGV